MMLTSSRAAIVLFCGEPSRDERQKRLPARFLSTVHQSLVRTVTRSGIGDLVIVSEIGQRFRITTPDITIEHPAETLAERIDIAVRFCFSSGYERVIILAGDVPTLSSEIIIDAMSSLQAAEPRFVLGGSSDGGFYLAGFNRLPSLDWDAILARRDEAGSTLSARAIERGFTLDLLPVVDDVDCRADAERLVALHGVGADLHALIARLVSLLLARPALPPSRIERPRQAFRDHRSLRAPPPSLANA